MLTDFVVKNFLSFKNLNRFTTKTNHEKAYDVVELFNNRYLICSVILGNNDTGKTNFLRGIYIVKKLLSGSVQTLEDNLNYVKTEPSYFEYEITLNGLIFNYGITLDLSKKEIIAEKLIRNFKSIRTIYERDTKKGTYKSDFTNNNMNKWLEELKFNNEILFLGEAVKRINIMGDNDHFLHKLKRVYNVLTGYNLINDSEYRIFKRSYSSYKCAVLCGMDKLGMDIIDIDYKEEDISSIKSKLSKASYENLTREIENLQDNDDYVLRVNNMFYTLEKYKGELKVYKLIFKHAGNKIYNEESCSTVKILDLIDATRPADGDFIIDDFDKGLDDKQTKELLKLFLDSNNPITMTSNNWDISKYNFLKSDSVWIIDKNNLGESTLHRLEVKDKETLD